MASGRRGGPPDLKSTLGSLLRTTLDQVGAVREVVEQQARGRSGILDQALGQRRRREALQALGEVIYGLAQRGELGDLALEPEVAMAIGEVDAADEDEHEGGDIPSRGRAEAVSSSSYRASGAPARASESSEEFRVWRPVRPSARAHEPHHHVEQNPAPRVTEDEPTLEEEPEASAVPRAESTGLSKRIPRRSAQRGSHGIEFVADIPRADDPDGDDDLEAYMHEDDVPDDE